MKMSISGKTLKANPSEILPPPTLSTVANPSLLYNLRAQAAKLLKKPADQVRIVNSIAVCVDFYSTYYKVDKEIGRYDTSISPWLWLDNHRTHSTRIAGLRLMETFEKDNKKRLRYVVFSEEIPGELVALIFVGTGHVFRFSRHIKRVLSRHRKSQIVLQPILSTTLISQLQASTIGFYKLIKKHKYYKMRATYGILINGPPGNGKSMVCRWLTSLFEREGLSITTVTAAGLQHAYENGTLHQIVTDSSLVIFDDIDISFLSRSGGDSKMACALLAALDGVDSTAKEYCIRLFTTNEPLDSMDDAFKRPGRIDLCLTLEKPTLDLRLSLLKSWPDDITAHLDADDVAKRTDGFSFSEMEALRSSLVINTLMHNDPWNVERALNEVRTRLTGLQPVKGTGFAAVSKPT